MGFPACHTFVVLKDMQDWLESPERSSEINSVPVHVLSNALITADMLHKISGSITAAVDRARQESENRGKHISARFDIESRKTFVRLMAEKTWEQAGMLFVAFKQHGCSCTSENFESLSKFLSLQLILNIIDKGESYLKWKLCDLMSIFLNQSDEERVPRPDWVSEFDNSSVLFGGRFFVFLKRKLQSRAKGPEARRRGLQFFLDLANLKKAMPPVSDAVADAELSSTFEMLTHDNSDRLPSPRAGQSDDETLFFELRRTVREVFTPAAIKQAHVQFLIPSISGHADSRRNKVGALGKMVRDDMNKLITPISSIEADTYCPVTRKPLYSRSSSKSLVLSWATCNGFSYRKKNEKGKMVTDKIQLQLLLNISLTIDEYLTPSATLNYFPFLKAVNMKAKEEEGKGLPAKLIWLKEPFKTRIISAGPEYSYYLGRYRQKLVHGVLRKHPGFELIGQPLTADYLEKRLRPFEGGFFVSGDYKAATNMLRPDYTEVVAREIALCFGWSEEQTENYVACLIHHVIKHPDGRSADQKWGQLMGSPDSFPILCLINMAMSRFALEQQEHCDYGCYSVDGEQRMGLSIERSGICVNGDDIAFVTNDEGYALWEHITARAGLLKSVGKNYCHKDFVCLNSMFFEVEREYSIWTDFKMSYSYKYIPFTNYGLMIGSNGKTTIDTTDRNELKNLCCPRESDIYRTPDLATLAEDLIDGHKYEYQVELLNRFYSIWSPILKSIIPDGCSWFLPKHLGGLGLPILGRSTSHVASYLQLRMAAHLAIDIDYQHQLMSIQRVLVSDSSFLYDQAKKHLPSEIPYDITRLPEQNPYDGMALAWAFKETEKIDLEEDIKQFDLWRRRYRFLWRRCLKSTTPAMTFHEAIISRPMYKSYNPLCVLSPELRLNLQIWY